MRIRSLYRAVVLCSGFGLVSGTASAAAISFQGVFSTDDQIQIFSFVAGPGSAILRTWGYAGSGAGTNAAGQSILAGGFDPILSLYGPGLALLPTTPLMNSTDNGPGATVLPDPTSTDRFDSYIDTGAVPLTLTAGATYFLVLTESPSIPLGNTFGAGFSGQGQGNYTGGLYGCGAAPFCDADGFQRNGNWAVDISGVTSAQVVGAVPEPASLWLAAGALAVILSTRRRNAFPSSTGR